MGDAPLIVGVSGLRGIVGESLPPEVAVRYAGAFGGWLRDNPHYGREVVVARDGRAGGETFYHAAISALLGCQIDVVSIGIATTPTVGAYITHELHSAACGIIVTASHNPGEWNGLKILVGDRYELTQDMTPAQCHLAYSISGARAPTANEAAEIIRRFESGDVGFQKNAGKTRSQSFTTTTDAIGRHCHMVWEAVIVRMLHEYEDHDRARPLDAYSTAFKDCKKWKVVLDSVNSSGAKAGEELIRSFHAEAIQLFGDGSGIFPHTPEPTAENLSGEGGLCDAVPGLKADVGFAQDPDADRLAIVDENGRYIGEEYTLALCAESVLSWVDTAPEGTPPRSTGQPVLVANLSTSRMIDDVAAKYGGRVVRTPVGEANVVEVMKKLKAEGQNVVLGGEGNGGVIWPEVVYVRDSLGSMALVLSLMTRTGKTVSELVAQSDSYSPGGSGYAIVKRKVAIASKADAKPAVEKIAGHYDGHPDATIDLQDGVRVDFPEAGVWVHVRASNTEPIMRLIAEAPTDEAAESILAEVEGVIAG